MPDLCSGINEQVNLHHKQGYDYEKEIICTIASDSSGIYVAACLDSNRYASHGKCSADTIWFYKKHIESLEQGFDHLTTEVNKAKKKYPDLNFYIWLRLLKFDYYRFRLHYVTLSNSEKAEMISRGMPFEESTVNVYEIFSAASWSFSPAAPRQHIRSFDKFQVTAHGKEETAINRTGLFEKKYAMEAAL